MNKMKIKLYSYEDDVIKLHKRDDDSWDITIKGNYYPYDKDYIKHSFDKYHMIEEYLEKIVIDNKSKEE